MVVVVNPPLWVVVVVRTGLVVVTLGSWRPLGRPVMPPVTPLIVVVLTALPVMTGWSRSLIAALGAGIVGLACNNDPPAVKPKWEEVRTACEAEIATGFEIDETRPLTPPPEIIVPPVTPVVDTPGAPPTIVLVVLGAVTNPPVTKFAAVVVTSGRTVLLTPATTLEANSGVLGLDPRRERRVYDDTLPDLA